MNQDVYLQGGVISKLIKVSLDNPDYGILSPVHLNGKGTSLDNNFKIFINPSRCPGFYQDFLENKVFKKSIYEVKFVNAAAWLMTRDCIETVGGFNPSFFHYGEDDNYCQRVLYHGLKIGIVAKVEILHDRENRTYNRFFQDKKIVRKRAIITEYSNPSIGLVLPNYLKDKLKLILKNLFTFRIKALRIEIQELLIHRSIDFEVIISCREKTKLKGLSFIKA